MGELAWDSATRWDRVKATMFAIVATLFFPIVISGLIIWHERGHFADAAYNLSSFWKIFYKKVIK
jgi:hypothetical protein